MIKTQEGRCMSKPTVVRRALGGCDAITRRRRSQIAQHTRHNHSPKPFVERRTPDRRTDVSIVCRHPTVQRLDSIRAKGFEKIGPWTHVVKSIVGYFPPFKEWR